MSRYMTRRRQFANPELSPDPSTYAGERAAPYVAPALKLANTLTNNYVRQIDGIQNKAVISSFSSDTGVIQAANCGWNDGDNMTLGERVLELTDLAVMEALCRGTLLPTWAGMTGARETMTAGNPEFVTFSMATVAGYAAQGVENGIWTGGMALGQKGFLSNDGVWDGNGYAASILGLASVTEKVVTANGFTAANILKTTGAFYEVYDKAVTTVPAILNKPDIAFYCGTKVAGEYMQALATAGGGISHDGSTTVSSVGAGSGSLVTNQAFGSLQYLGIPIQVCQGMPAEALILTYRENLVVGSNLNTDYTTAQYIDAWQFDGSDNIKIAMRFGCGVQVGIPADCVVGAYTAVIG